VCHCWSRCLSDHLIRSGGESEVALGASLVAPFIESEQLGSHVRLPVPTSKPVSPLSRNRSPDVAANGRAIVSADDPRATRTTRCGGGPTWPDGRPSRRLAWRWPGACRRPGGPGPGPARAWPGRS
jgi:hypothetical protein